MNTEKEIAMLLLDYINSNYDVVAEFKPVFLYKNNIYIKAEKYDLNIGVGKTDKNHYLFGKCEYYIDFDYEANKKYRNQLCWHGGGYDDSFNKNYFSNVDKFLSEFVEKKKLKQFDIFDYEKE